MSISEKEAQDLNQVFQKMLVQCGYRPETLPGLQFGEILAQITPLPEIPEGGGLLYSNNGQLSWSTPPSTLPPLTGNGNKYLYNDGAQTTWKSILEIPGISGNAGKVLTTDGNNLQWVLPTDYLPAQAGHAGEVLVTDGMFPYWHHLDTGITTTEHENISSLTHEIAADSVLKINRDGLGQVTSLVTWTNTSETQKMREEIVTRDVQNKIQSLTVKQYDLSGIPIASITYNYHRNLEGRISSIQLTRENS